MTLQIEFYPEVAARLREEAAVSGKAITALIVEAVEEKFAAGPTPTPSRISPQEWAAKLDAWAASHRRLGYDVDDSRETIYAGRGE